MSERVVSIKKKDHFFVAELGHRTVESNGTGCIVRPEQQLCESGLDINVVLREASIVAARLGVPLVFETEANRPLAKAMEEGYCLTQS